MSMILHSRHRTLTLQDRVAIVATLNVTPDSFVEASRAASIAEVLKKATQHLQDGADILEIGGESTGPGSPDVSVDAELKRVLPALDALRREFPDAWIAVDTWKSEVAKKAIDAGADMINDVTAGRGDDTMFDIVASAKIPIVLMFSKDDSARTTRAMVDYDDVIETIRKFLSERMSAAKKSGVALDHIILDPGLGHFVSSKSEYSFEILARLKQLTDLGPIFVSPSRKSFLAGPTNLPASERLSATIAASALAATQGATFLRTHDTASIKKALDAVSVLRGL